MPRRLAAILRLHQDWDSTAHPVATAGDGGVCIAVRRYPKRSQEGPNAQPADILGTWVPEIGRWGRRDFPQPNRRSAAPDGFNTARDQPQKTPQNDQQQVHEMIRSHTPYDSVAGLLNACYKSARNRASDCPFADPSLGGSHRRHSYTTKLKLEILTSENSACRCHPPINHSMDRGRATGTRVTQT